MNQAGESVREIYRSFGVYTSSDKVVDFIKGWEGFKASPYKVLNSDGEPTGKWTVGYGHEISNEEYLSGSYNNITEERAMGLLMSDIAAAEVRVNRFISINGGTTLNQNQYDALVSLSMNSGYIERFPNLSSNFSQANHGGVAFEFLDITNGGLSGLVKRRAAEYNMYLNGDYSGRP
ncbi:hypothetical protein C3B51_22725 [Pseudoalteromonas rubra]|uniref:Lysozyme n=1 Tax=Pseudoalteromonas rubra TaxID=43658 RepID=A0A4Q7E230_9GAMM|nr:hypothetical protein C3B51_22725 [Pseudoalteromonas rubra]